MIKVVSMTRKTGNPKIPAIARVEINGISFDVKFFNSGARPFASLPNAWDKNAAKFVDLVFLSPELNSGLITALSEAFTKVGPEEIKVFIEENENGPDDIPSKEIENKTATKPVHQTVDDFDEEPYGF